jgi:hypothetical protein
MRFFIFFDGGSGVLRNPPLNHRNHRERYYLILKGKASINNSRSFTTEPAYGGAAGDQGAETQRKKQDIGISSHRRGEGYTPGFLLFFSSVPRCLSG